MASHRATLGGTMRESVANAPRPIRWMIVAAVACGLLGGVVGLILGLNAHPGTAWFAVFEVGVPSTLVGGVVGFVAGGLRYAVRPRH